MTTAEFMQETKQLIDTKGGSTGDSAAGGSSAMADVNETIRKLESMAQQPQAVFSCGGPNSLQKYSLKDRRAKIGRENSCAVEDFCRINKLGS